MLRVKQTTKSNHFNRKVIQPLRNYSSFNNTFKFQDLSSKPFIREGKPPFGDLKFGTQFTDNMLEASWTRNKGWERPAIVPYHNLSLDPAASVFHYAIELFEGMKAYLGKDGEVRLFRPDMNAERMNNSAARLMLPTFDSNEFIQCLKKLVSIEKNWVPPQKGYSLYLRPTMISTNANLGVSAASEALMYVIMSPVGPYYPQGFKPVQLYANPKYVRAFPGGTGDSKLGANYGPTILPQAEAAEKGFSQVLWLIGEEHKIAEVGTMNVFFVLRNADGHRELVTPPLDGTILPGVTRDSILQICRRDESMGLRVSERQITMPELMQAVSDGTIEEAFGAGTAAVVSPIDRITFKDQDLHIPLDKNDPEQNAGPIARQLFDRMWNIQTGREVFDPSWSVVVDDQN